MAIFLKSPNPFDDSIHVQTLTIMITTNQGLESSSHIPNIKQRSDKVAETVCETIFFNHTETKSRFRGWFDNL